MAGLSPLWGGGPVPGKRLKRLYLSFQMGVVVLAPVGL